MMGSRSSSNNNSRINSNSSMATTLRGLAASTEVGRLVKEKQRRLVEVPYTASVAESLRAMQAHNILAVPVAAPPGHWIGAGGSSIVQSDASTGHALKQYIGIVSTLDILLHLSELHPDRAAGHRHPSPDANLATGGIIGSNSSFHRQEKEKAKEKEEEELLARPISSLIGHSLEGLSLWSLSSHTSVLEAMEPMSKGIHRALVAIESPPSDHGVETDISSPGYAMLTQTDLIRFLHEAMAFLARSAGYGSDSLGSRSVESLGVVRSDVYGVPATMPLVDVLKCMSSRALTAVAVVDVQQNEELSRKAELIPVRNPYFVLV
jgi:CBS domain-containing protein